MKSKVGHRGWRSGRRGNNGKEGMGVRSNGEKMNE